VAYLVICFFCGLSGGIIGKVKGSSFFIWFLVSAVLLVFGILAAVLYRVDRAEPRRRCPRCNSQRMLHDAICTRCGTELEYPESEVDIYRPLDRA
jgi:hypothetical protein